LKLIIASLIVFTVIILFLFALFPSEVSVSRLIRINLPADPIQKKIADLREWGSWNNFLSDAFAENSVSYAQGTVDSIHIDKAYVSVELVKTVPDTVYTKWQHGKKSFTGDFILTEMNGQTVLEWTLHFHVRWFPWEKLASMFYEKGLGPAMEKSLINLRDQLEPAGK
jgi:hypothetical protein